MPRTFRIGAQSYSLARARDILSPPDDVAWARDRLGRMDGLDEFTVRRMLDDNGLLPLSFRPGDDVLDLLARAWVQRLVTIVEHREPARLLDGPEVHDLVPPRALGELPTGPPPGPEPGETTPTWVSFEVVDDQGNPADGVFRCQLDARLEGGELQQKPHRFEALKRGASAQVYLEMLRWPVATDGPAVPQYDPAKTDPEEPSSPAFPTPDPDGPFPQTSFAIRVATQTGGSFAGTELRARLPDGTVQSAVLDSRSSWRVDALVLSGDVTVELVPPIRSDPSAEPLEVDLGAVPIIPAAAPTFTGPSGEVHTVVVDLPGPRCVRIVGAAFALNRAFILPEAMEGIRLLRHMYDQLPNARLLVVGHTDTTGKASRNQSLSLQRAEALVQFMSDDVDAWYEYYGKETDFSRRWGVEEDLAMLSALPDLENPYYSESHDDHSIVAATKRFQAAKGLPVDGELGEATRRALIADYMAIDQTSLPEDVVAVAHGCGQNFLAIPTDFGVPEIRNRRVEVFLFPEQIEPAPPGPMSLAGSTEYPAWIDAIVEQRTFRPSEAGLGSLTILTDLPASMAHAKAPSYRLWSTDGAYECTLTPEDGVVVNDHIRLEFKDMPRRSFFTLEVHELSDVLTPVFEDVPFRELGMLSSRLDGDAVDPFGWEEE